MYIKKVTLTVCILSSADIFFQYELKKSIILSECQTVWDPNCFAKDISADDKLSPLRFLLLEISLTHLSRMNFPISIGRMSLFQILGVLGGIFHFY